MLGAKKGTGWEVKNLKTVCTLKSKWFASQTLRHKILSEHAGIASEVGSRSLIGKNHGTTHRTRGVRSPESLHSVHSHALTDVALLLTFFFPEGHAD